MMRFLILALCLALTGCGTARPHPLAIPSPFQVPLPFSGAERNDELLRSITETASVVLDPVDGLSGPFSEALLADIARAAQDHDIPLAAGVDARTADHLRGRFEAEIVRGEGLHGVIAWMLETSNGTLIDEFETRAPMRTYDEWDESLFDAENTVWREAMAGQTAAALAAALDARPMTARRLHGLPGASAALGPPILVPRVTGAPGDGNISLTRSVRALLAQADIFVVDPDSPPDVFDPAGAYTLQGAVVLGEPSPGAGQPISIAWDLYDPQGNHLGNVAQENLIEPGSLNGPWGEVAVYAGMGAVEGIMALLALIPPDAS